MHVNFIGAEFGRVLADLREVLRRVVVREPADGEHRARRAIATTDEDVVGIFERRAIEKAIDRMHVAFPRRAGPEMEPRRRLGNKGLRAHLLRAFAHLSARPELGKLDNFGTHNAHP